uniref:AAR2 C-terminal domain-containing protein n=1 Tax=Leptocylindrus danicus TaxID=163516 RepID=A0A7S2NYW9_9STRA
MSSPTALAIYVPTSCRVMLCSVQQQIEQQQEQQQEHVVNVNHGLLLLFNNHNTVSCNEVTARKWDPRIEELSKDDGISDCELCQAIAAKINHNNVHVRMDVNGVSVVAVSLEQFMTSTEEANGANLVTMQPSWNECVNFISRQVLQRLGVKSGDKIVAGSLSSSLDYLHGDMNIVGNNDNNQADGVELRYHPIPCALQAQQGQQGQQKGQLNMMRHPGTKRYFSRLKPFERSELIFQNYNSNSNSSLLDDVLHRVYADRYMEMLGELQLAFCVFLNMSCLASFEHWRDLVALLCFACAGSDGNTCNGDTTSSRTIVHQRPKLYSSFLEVLFVQLHSIDSDFFHEMEYSADNFLIPALRCLVRAAVSSSSSNTKTIAVLRGAKRVVELMSTRFNIDIESEVMDDEIDNDLTKADCNLMSKDNGRDEMFIDEDDYDEDGPVIVPLEEVEASLSRSATSTALEVVRESNAQSHDPLRQKYPLLFASVSPKEDIMMACARILDDKRDVSLVREASSYLEDVVATSDAQNMM